MYAEASSRSRQLHYQLSCKSFELDSSHAAPSQPTRHAYDRLSRSRDPGGAQRFEARQVRAELIMTGICISKDMDGGR